MLQDFIFEGKEENIIVIERNMSYEAVILDIFILEVTDEEVFEEYRFLCAVICHFYDSAFHFDRRRSAGDCEIFRFCGAV